MQVNELVTITLGVNARENRDAVRQLLEGFMVLAVQNRVKGHITLFQLQEVVQYLDGEFDRCRNSSVTD